MKKRYLFVVLIVVLAYTSIIVWDKTGSDSFERVLSKQGQVVTFDQVDTIQNNNIYEDDSFENEEVYEQEVWTTPDQVFTPGNIPNNELALEFGNLLQTMAEGMILPQTEAAEPILSGNSVASLLASNQIRINDAFVEATRSASAPIKQLQGTLGSYHKWLSSQ